MSDAEAFTSSHLLELLQEDLRDYLERESLGPQGERVSVIHLQERLAREVFGFGYRTFMYLLAGERPFPIDRAVPWCRSVGSTRILEHLAHEAGAAIIPHPDVGEIDEYDLVGELTRNIEKAADQTKTLVELFDAKPTKKRLAAVTATTRSLVHQALRCEAIYRDAVKDGPLHRRRARRSLAAGQGWLFREE